MTSVIGNSAVGIRNYPGAKAAPGVFHAIINNIPPHDCFVEPFAGSAAITERKRPAAATVLVDAAAGTCSALVAKFRLGAVRVVHGDGPDWLLSNRGELGKRAVVYCDPPYLGSTRGHRAYYAHEFMTAGQHERLLAVLHVLAGQGTAVLVSGRRCELYDCRLADWRRVDYSTATHGGPVTESLWCSFPEPTELHDYGFLGRDFRERQDLKRKIARWRRRLAAMPILERRVISAALGMQKTGDKRPFPHHERDGFSEERGAFPCS